MGVIRVGAFLSGAALILALVGCSEQVPPTIDVAAPEPSGTEAPARLAVPEGAAIHLVAGVDGEPEQRGSAVLETSISSLAGGAVQSIARPSSRAWRMPSYQDQGSYPRAVVLARPGPEEEALSPGRGAFGYGADIRLDELSTGRVEDNGNNVLQRGLSSDSSMFKLEVDAEGRPGCTVKGQDGTVSVLAAGPITAGTWYRIRCERQRQELRLLVSEYGPSGPTTQVRLRTGETGPVTFDGAQVPVSVGGKVAHDGSVIRSATDQFNGMIGNAYYAMG
jgi:hypothetical protein